MQGTVKCDGDTPVGGGEKKIKFYAVSSLQYHGESFQLESVAEIQFQHSSVTHVCSLYAVTNQRG